MEGELTSFVVAALGELAVERALVDTYTHRGYLKGAAEHLVVVHYVAVDEPVVVVGGSAVVLFTASELAAYLRDQGGLVLFKEGILALLGSESPSFIQDTTKRG